ncbi:MAG: glucose 1-dehydrogenase [Stenomitos rutilans HA7619-LM2]|nr:glucose 1-dehydrogenase [Stenomitos rutilans HA7619-LM2]
MKLFRLFSFSALSRRQILSVGAMGAAGVATTAIAAQVQANTKTPIAPETGKANAQGKFANKVVLITGATSGIGEATAYAFAHEGAKVMFCGRRENLGKQVEAKIKGFGGEGTYMRADVRQEVEVKALVDACVQKYGRIDIAFNNAGIESPPKSIAEMSLDEWNNVIATNQTGIFLAMKYEIPVMVQQGDGTIVNTASVGGHRGFGKIGPYGASKAAVLQMTRIAALEYADKNIRINSISPGAVDTPMLHRAISSWGLTPKEAAAPYPIQRLATSEEMARSVMWLASADASVVTGMDMDVTGGYLTK